MARPLRCHRLLAYDIPCHRPPVPQSLSRLRSKSLQRHVYGEFSDAKMNVGVLLVAILGDATCLVSWLLATKLTRVAYAGPRCRVARSTHEFVYRYTENVDLTTPTASVELSNLQHT